MSFPSRTWHTDGDPKDGATQTASEDVWKKDTSEYLISTAFQAVLRACRRRAPVRSLNTRRSAGKNDSGRCAGPGPAVRRCVETTGQDGAVFQHVCLAVIVAVCHTVGAVSERYVDSDIFTVERY